MSAREPKGLRVGVAILLVLYNFLWFLV